MKKQLLISCLMAAVILSGCKNQENLERSVFSKRKYTKGFYWSGFKLKMSKPQDDLAKEPKPDPMKYKAAPVFTVGSEISDGGFASVSGVRYGTNTYQLANDAELEQVLVPSIQAPHKDVVVVPKLRVEETKTAEEAFSFNDFMNKFPLDYGLDRPIPLEKRSLQIDKSVINSFAFRSMLGTGVVGTSFVISATALLSLLALTGSMLSFMIIGGKRRKNEGQTQFSSLTNAGLVLGSVVVVSSTIAIVSSLLV